MKQPFKIPCQSCDYVGILYLDSADIDKYLAGALVQNAFPYLTADQREMIISQTCNVCWDKMFAE